MINVPKPISVLIPDLPKGWFLMSYKVLSKNRLAIIATDFDLHAAWKSDREQKTVGTSWILSAEACAKIWIFDNGSLTESIDFPLQEPFPIIDQFPDGRWLVANAKSRIFRPDGTLERHIELGIHIEHIKIDDSGLIWVGWYDQGVFGNDNWRVPELEWPPSSSGIAAFDSSGALIKNASVHSIADCYALNTFNNEAWACTYTNFPIWQMKGDEQKIWLSNLSGVEALAVSYPFVLAAGGYNDDKNRLVLLRLDKDKAQQLATWQISEILNEAMDRKVIDGRGDSLHVVNGRTWYRWNVSHFVAKGSR